MVETIELLDLPNRIVLIYEIPGVFNRCENQFIQHSNLVTWIMESEFIFREQVIVNEENFRKKTQSDMEEFKKLVENS